MLIAGGFEVFLDPLILPLDEDLDGVGHDEGCDSRPASLRQNSQHASQECGPAGDTLIALHPRHFGREG